MSNSSRAKHKTREHSRWWKSSLSLFSSYFWCLWLHQHIFTDDSKSSTSSLNLYVASYLVLHVFSCHQRIDFLRDGHNQEKTCTSTEVIFNSTTAAQRGANLKGREERKMMQRISLQREHWTTSLLMCRCCGAMQRRRNQMRTTTLESIILSCQPHRKQIIWFMSLLPCFTSHVP